MCSAPESSILVKQPFDQKICASAVASSGTRLCMTSHSDAPTRSKRIPARARRYCPVMDHVHCLWMAFIVCTLYINRAAVSPRDAYKPGEVAVNRMKMHPSTELNTMLTHV